MNISRRKITTSVLRIYCDNIRTSVLNVGTNKACEKIESSSTSSLVSNSVPMHAVVIADKFHFVVSAGAKAACLADKFPNRVM